MPAFVATFGALAVEVLETVAVLHGLTPLLAVFRSVLLDKAELAGWVVEDCVATFCFNDSAEDKDVNAARLDVSVAAEIGVTEDAVKAAAEAMVEAVVGAVVAAFAFVVASVVAAGDAVVLGVAAGVVATGVVATGVVVVVAGAGVVVSGVVFVAAGAGAVGVVCVVV